MISDTASEKSNASSNGSRNSSLVRNQMYAHTSVSASTPSLPFDSNTSTAFTDTGTGNATATTTHTSSFQAVCAARVASQKKNLASAFAAGGKGGEGGFSAKETRALIRESTAAIEAAAKVRNRAEIYAINNFLKRREIEKYCAFQAEQEKKLSLDDISWCTADSSLMPTPRYRSEKERKYDPTPLSPSKTKKGKSTGGV